MNTAKLVFCIWIVVAAAEACFAALTPTDVSALLQQREAKLAQSQLTWSYQAASGHTVDATMIAKTKIDVNSKVHAQAKRSHITNQAAIRQMYDKQLNVAMRELIGFQQSSTGNVVTTRADGRTNIRSDTSTVQTLPTVVFKDTDDLYYDGKIAANAGSSNNVADIYAAPKTALSCFSTRVGRNMLNIAPEEASLLFGYNVLNSVDKAAWKIDSCDAKTIVLSTPRFGGDEIITVSLDRTHDNIPIDISVMWVNCRASHLTQHWHINAVQSAFGTYVPSTIKYEQPSPGSHSTHSWILSSIHTPGSITLSLPKNTGVTDYRLFGADITVDDAILKSQNRGETRMVTYRWSGKLPSESELRSIGSRNRAQEATDKCITAIVKFCLNNFEIIVTLVATCIAALAIRLYLKGRTRRYTILSERSKP